MHGDVISFTDLRGVFNFLSNLFLYRMGHWFQFLLSPSEAVFSSGYLGFHKVKNVTFGYFLLLDCGFGLIPKYFLFL